MESDKNRTWLIYRKSKKDPIRVEAACVRSVNGKYIFTDERGVDVGLYDISAMEGYSLEPKGMTTKPNVVVMVPSGPEQPETEREVIDLGASAKSGD